MVEIEVRKAEPGTTHTESTNLDVNEIIGKVRTFVDSIKEMSAGGEPMTVNVEGLQRCIEQRPRRNTNLPSD